MGTVDYEELLPDRRVERLAEMLFLVFPALPSDTDVVTFIVPEAHLERNGERRWKPPEAVFALLSDNPRANRDPLYRGKRVMTTAGMDKRLWDQEERERAHFVSAREDPAWKFLAFTAKTHLQTLQNYRDLN